MNEYDIIRDKEFYSKINDETLTEADIKMLVEKNVLDASILSQSSTIIEGKIVRINNWQVNCVPHSVYTTFLTFIDGKFETMSCIKKRY